MEAPSIENIIHGLEPIALIIRAEFDEPGVHFFTPSSFSQQVAAMTHPAGHKIEPHVHNMVNRQVLYTQEVLLIRRGQVRVSLFSSIEIKQGPFAGDGDKTRFKEKPACS